MRIILALLLLLLAIPAHAALLKVDTADFQTVALTNIETRLTPVGGAGSSGGKVITIDRKTVYTDTNGIAWYSNTVAKTYKLEIIGPHTTTTANLLVPDTSAEVNAADILTTTTTSQTYTTAAADGRFVQITRPRLGTNASVVGQVWTATNTTGYGYWSNAAGAGEVSTAQLLVVSNQVQTASNSLQVAKAGVTNPVFIGTIYTPSITPTSPNLLWGTNAGQYVGTGSNSVFIGHYAGSSFTNLGENVAIGYQSQRYTQPGLDVTNDGNYNVSVGAWSLLENRTGDHLVAVGWNAARNNYSGDANTALGEDALLFNRVGGNNVAVGAHTLQYATNAIGSSVAVGTSALLFQTDGHYNTAVGDSVGIAAFGSVGNVTEDHRMTFLGALAGVDKSVNNTIFQRSTAIGFNAKVTGSDQVVIGGSTVNAAYIRGTNYVSTLIATNFHSTMGVSNAWHTSPAATNIALNFNLRAMYINATNALLLTNCIGLEAGEGTVEKTLRVHVVTHTNSPCQITFPTLGGNQHGYRFMTNADAPVLLWTTNSTRRVYQMVATGTNVMIVSPSDFQ